MIDDNWKKKTILRATPLEWPVLSNRMISFFARTFDLRPCPLLVIWHCTVTSTDICSPRDHFTMYTCISGDPKTSDITLSS